MATSHQLKRILGSGSSYQSIITSSAIATISFFYIYTLGSFFKIAIYPFQNRVTNLVFFDNFVITKNVDHIIISVSFLLYLVLTLKGIRSKIATIGIFSTLITISLLSNYDVILDLLALISLPTIFALFLHTRFSSRKIFNDYSNLTKNYLAIIGLALGVIALFLVSVPIFYTSPVQVSDRNYVYEIFLLFSSFSPIFIFLLIAAYPVKILVNYLTQVLKIKKIDLKIEHNIALRSKIVYLSFFILLSIFISLVPHFETINPDNQNVSVDTGYYVNWVGSLMESKDHQDFIQNAFVDQAKGDRPISLIAIFGLAKTSNADLRDVIEYLPLILSPALVLATYFLTREITSNDTASLFAAFLTVVSFQMGGGIYSGFFANWLALIIGYISFVFFFRFLKTSGKTNLVVYSALMVLLLFSHVYTWSVLAIVMIVFLLIMLRLNYYRRKLVFVLFFVILSSIAIDVGRTALTGSSGGIESDIIKAQEKTGLEQYPLRWENLLYNTTTILGGQISNFIILMLGLYWLFRCNVRDSSNIFLIVFLMIGIIPILFGNWQMQIRLLYDMPFQIPAALALTYILKKENGLVRSIPICIWLIAISIQNVSNFYFVSPME